MSIFVAVTDDREGRAALAAAGREAALLRTDLVVVDLTGRQVDLASLLAGVSARVVTYRGDGPGDEVDAVLEAIDERVASFLVVGVRRRSPLGRVLLGGIAQRLILEAPVAVLAVKAPPLPERREENGTRDREHETSSQDAASPTTGCLSLPCLVGRLETALVLLDRLRVDHRTHRPRNV